MILALDPSLSCIGWAVLTLDGERIVEYGKHRPRGDTLDEKLTDAHFWLRWMLDADSAISPIYGEQITAYAFEMPIVYRNPATTIKLAQLVGALRVAAFPWVQRTIEINPGARLSALGLPVNLKRAVAKERIIANVNATYGLELKPKEHDIADSIAIGVAASRKLKLAQVVAK